MSIFVIDDDMVSQFATRYCIQQYYSKFDVTICSSAEEGLLECIAMLKAINKLPDYIFLDLNMPEMDGWGFLDNFSKLTNNKFNSKVYILSAFESAKDLRKAKEHEFVSGYFSKPLTKRNLETIFEMHSASQRKK